MSPRGGAIGSWKFVYIYVREAVSRLCWPQEWKPGFFIPQLVSRTVPKPIPKMIAPRSPERRPQVSPNHTGY